MIRYRIFCYCILMAFICGCTVTGRLHRKEYGTDLAHSTAQQREFIEQDQSERAVGYIEYTRADSSKVFLIPTAELDGETVMSLDIDEIVVVSRSRSLAERMGKVNIDFVVTMPKQLQGNCQSVVVTPVLHKNDEITELEDLTIRGGLFSKVQQRNYWQLDTYKNRYNPDQAKERWAYDRFIYYPFPQGARLDSVVEHKNTMRYYYTQQVDTKGVDGPLLITLQGNVIALDRSYYRMPFSDTLRYNISSMINFIDTATRYVTKVVEKYAEVKDRNQLTFPVNRTEIIDTLGNNRSELDRIEQLMREIIDQKDFHIDSIVITASSSPEGALWRNKQLSEGRAQSLRSHLVKRFPSAPLSELITVRAIGEDWNELVKRILNNPEVLDREAIVKLIDETGPKNQDALESEIKRQFPADYSYIREHIYPALRAVSFKYDLRRVDMLKDTIHTMVPDLLYTRGVAELKARNYDTALELLAGFSDRNTAICLLSLGYDDKALQILDGLPRNSTIEYLSAIAAARLGRESLAMGYFEKAVELNESLQFRVNLDPELSELINKRANHEKQE